ncbi:hypothetical protein HMPREF0578_1418 [Mobiluncus mulieris 28-1]|uniref:Uncharacterized protein n=1 Tax=Mobiluncus mulieris ATCC 35239 TaxID=871571 RepID=E0QNJ2_9ACTO|nr:hypothetical protein HMPREF0578_1418 [Mobiluncus mulieris 28-1]EFM46964.1 hypothetical protein HMPREF0580_0456 [Mobiluncus mulieris ATCC 35239]
MLCKCYVRWEVPLTDFPWMKGRQAKLPVAAAMLLARRLNSAALLV